MKDFHVSETVAILPLTTYVLGLAFGPMLSAPISETLGRMGTYRYTVPISAAFTLGAGFAPNISALCILRFFAGFFGGASLPVCAGSAADLFHARNFAVAGTWLLYFPFLGKHFLAIGNFISTDNSPQVQLLVQLLGDTPHRTKVGNGRSTRSQFSILPHTSRCTFWRRLILRSYLPGGGRNKKQLKPRPNHPRRLYSSVFSSSPCYDQQKCCSLNPSSHF